MLDAGMFRDAGLEAHGTDALSVESCLQAGEWE
jgi:hypothetical protein